MDKNGDTPKCLVDKEIMETPTEMDENWGYSYFRKAPYWIHSDSYMEQWVMVIHHDQ